MCGASYIFFTLSGGGLERIARGGGGGCRYDSGV